MNHETPLHKVQGLGSAHSGVQHFWRLRVSGAILGLLTLWFAYSVLGLVGASTAAVLFFFQTPVNAILMGVFVILCAYHGALGIREVIEDYVHGSGMKIFLLLVNRVFGTLVALISLVALVRFVVT
jgi:succinate dehydrogenase / fumarate reductase membrane anchor subunit